MSGNDQTVQKTPEELKLEEIQKKLDDIEQKVSLETREIEKKYAVEEAPVLAERAQVIKSIPGFWKKAIENHLPIVSSLSDEDIEIVSYLEDLHVEEHYDNVDAFTVTLFFKQGNPYFSNEKISKTFRFDSEKEIFQVEASKIDWKEGKDLAANNKSLDEEEEEEGEDSFSWFGSWEDKDLYQEGDEIADYIRRELWPQPGKFFHLELGFDAEDD